MKTFWLGLYLLGFVLSIVGLAYGAHLLHVPPLWIGVGVITLAALGIRAGVTRTRQRDPELKGPFR